MRYSYIPVLYGAERKWYDSLEDALASLREEEEIVASNPHLRFSAALAGFVIKVDDEGNKYLAICSDETGEIIDWEPFPVIE